MYLQINSLSLSNFTTLHFCYLCSIMMQINVSYIIELVCARIKMQYFSMGYISNYIHFMDELLNLMRSAGDKAGRNYTLAYSRCGVLTYELFVIFPLLICTALFYWFDRKTIFKDGIGFDTVKKMSHDYFDIRQYFLSVYLNIPNFLIEYWKILFSFYLTYIISDIYNTYQSYLLLLDSLLTMT